MAMRPGLDRQSVIVAAAEIADAEGLGNVTLAAVADRLGVRKPSLYNHINGLPELKRELAIWGTNQLTAAIREAAIGKAKKDAISAIAAAYRAFAHQRPGLYRAIVATPDRNCPGMQTAIANMMAVLKTVLTPYHLTDEDKTHAVRGLRSLMHGFVSLEAAGWFASSVDREESYNQLIATFICGVEASHE